MYIYIYIYTYIWVNVKTERQVAILTAGGTSISIESEQNIEIRESDSAVRVLSEEITKTWLLHYCTTINLRLKTDNTEEIKEDRAPN